MILPIYAYGQPVLKKKAAPIGPDYPGLEQLISDMFETMYQAHGVGLAAPQVGLPIRLFVIDSTLVLDEAKDGEKGRKQVFINAEIIEQEGDVKPYEEGCLSIPGIRGDVDRPSRIRIRYCDASFAEHEEVVEGVTARVIQHEYDHIEGVLFIEHLKPLKKTMIRRKLEQIRQGKIDAEYRMKFAAIR